MWCVVFLQCSEIESNCFEVFQYLPPARMKETQLMSTRPHVQEARERFKKIGEGHVVRCVVFLQCSEIESDCFQIFQSQFGNPQISPFNFLSCSACWSKKQDAGMETSHAKRIFSDNGTCFGSNRSHLPQCFIKALRFLLAWLLCFYTENPRIFFWKAIFATAPIVPAVTIHTLPWKMRVETCLLSFQYGILPGSFPFRAWCGDFQFRGCISTKTLSSKRGLLTGTSWNWRVCPLHAWQ